MLFSFYCTDYEHTQDARRAQLEAHLQYVETHMDAIKVAGPLSKKGEMPFLGSLYIIEADSQAEANELFEADPYFSAGIWKKIERECFQGFAGTWLGGKNW